MTIPEPSDGEALPPADERDGHDLPGEVTPATAMPAEPWSGEALDVPAGTGTAGDGGTGDADLVQGGAGIGGPDDDDVATRPGAQVGPAVDAEPTPAGDATAAPLDVEGGAGIGGTEEAAEGVPGLVTEPASTPADEARAVQQVQESVPEAPARQAEAQADAVAQEPTATQGEAVAAPPAAEPAATDPEVVAAPPAAEPAAPPAETPETTASPEGAAGPEGAASPEPGAATGRAMPDAAAAATLPPPPPELAEVPTDAGRIVAGRVREVAGEDVIVDLDDGRVGVINRRNLGVDGAPAAVLSVGDPVEGAVLARSDPQHRVVLSRTWALKKRAWEAVAVAAAENTVLTGRVVSVGQKGVVVDVGVRGFVPASHLEIGPVADLQSYAGQELSLRVLDVDTDRERLVLSRRSLLLKEQRRSLHDVLSALQPGEVRRGKVTSLSDYGAFVDLGGVNGLVHLSELSWQRVRHPSDVVTVGDEIDVKVLDVKVKKRRVSLSIRQLSDDPLGSLVPGEIRSGPVTRLVDFGAFVDLSGVEGLVHLSELAEYRVSAPEEIVAPGEEVRVKVLSVDRKRRRVELSIRQAAEYGG